MSAVNALRVLFVRVRLCACTHAVRECMRAARLRVYLCSLQQRKWNLSIMLVSVLPCAMATELVHPARICVLSALPCAMATTELVRIARICVCAHAGVVCVCLCWSRSLTTYFYSLVMLSLLTPHASGCVAS